MRTIWVLVTWDEDMPSVQMFEDEHDAIEMLKAATPYVYRANLYRVSPDSSWAKVEGW